MKRVISYKNDWQWRGFNSESAYNKIFSSINSQLAAVERTFANYYNFDSVELDLGGLLLSDIGSYDLFINFKNLVFDLNGTSFSISRLTSAKFFIRISLTEDEYLDAKEGKFDCSLAMTFPEGYQLSQPVISLTELVHRAYDFFFYHSGIIDNLIDNLNEYFENYKFNAYVNYPEIRAPGTIKITIEGFDPYLSKVKYDHDEALKYGWKKVEKNCFERYKKSIKARYNRYMKELSDHENSLLDE